MAEFDAMIEQDIKDNFEPMLLAANAGSYGVGQCDELKQLNELCYKHKMWIHLEGFYLSSLALYSIPTALNVHRNFLLTIVKKNVHQSNNLLLFSFLFFKKSLFSLEIV